MKYFTVYDKPNRDAFYKYYQFTPEEIKYADEYEVPLNFHGAIITFSRLGSEWHTLLEAQKELTYLDVEHAFARALNDFKREYYDVAEVLSHNIIDAFIKVIGVLNIRSEAKQVLYDFCQAIRSNQDEKALETLLYQLRVVDDDPETIVKRVLKWGIDNKNDILTGIISTLGSSAIVALYNYLPDILSKIPLLQDIQKVNNMKENAKTVVDKLLTENLQEDNYDPKLVHDTFAKIKAELADAENAFLKYDPSSSLHHIIKVNDYSYSLKKIMKAVKYNKV